MILVFKIPILLGIHKTILFMKKNFTNGLQAKLSLLLCTALVFALPEMSQGATVLKTVTSEIEKKEQHPQQPTQCLLPPTGEKTNGQGGTATHGSWSNQNPFFSPFTGK